MIRNNNINGIIFYIKLLLMIGLMFASYKIEAAEEKESRLDYQGDIFFQGFYLQRDLPLIRTDELGRTDSAGTLLPFPYESVCDSPEVVRSLYNPGVNSRCKEEDDFYRMRLRANFSYRASPFVDILYGMEVGYITFGREDNVYGPDSGGGGSGRTNLETQQLLMKIHNATDRASLSAGVFSFSTPNGIVVANSGAGFKGNLEFPGQYSSVEAVFIRSEDNSRRDDDSNGFSDSNYRDVHLGILDWKFTGIPNVRSELYGVYRRDGDPDPSASDGGETSQLYWGGLYLTFSIGPVDFVIHGVGNAGSFTRANKYDHLPVYNRILILRTLEASGYTLNPDTLIGENLSLDGLTDLPGTLPYLATITDAYQAALPGEKHRVNAGAGNFEAAWQASDFVRVVFAAAGATGRLGLEEDGSLSDYRADQFRTAGSAFQFSDIAVDTSGGYSIFSGGRLTGLNTGGIRLLFRLYESLEAHLAYSSVHLNHRPAMRGNAYYTKYPFYLTYQVDTEGRVSPIIDWNVRFTQHPGIRESTLYLGEEWDAGFSWRPWTGFLLEGKAAWFDSGDGYKILKDVQYGDDIYEFSLAAKQEF